MLQQIIAFIAQHLLTFSLHLDNTQSFPKPLKPEEERECIRIMEQSGKEEAAKARAKLIEHNLRLVVHIAKKYYAMSADQEDLISIGTIGLIKAANTFHADKNIRFATYASRCIENEILMHFRAARKTAGEIYLSDPVDGEDSGSSITLFDTIADPRNLEDDVELKLHSQKLMEQVKRLPARQRRIIVLRYGLNGEEPMVQREVADMLGISRSYVSRIEKKALAALRSACGGDARKV